LRVSSERWAFQYPQVAMTVKALLTDTKLKNAKPRARPYKIGDGGWLYLLVKPSKSKLWRMAYRYGGREKLLALGSYPEVSLKEAREQRDVARERLRNARRARVSSRAWLRAGEGVASDATLRSPQHGAVMT
jgi:hypothetical protein